MILGAVTPKNQKDLRSSLHPNTIKPILDMGIDIIFESGLGAGMDVNDEVLTSLGAKSVSREACLSKSDVLMSTSPIASNEISLMKWWKCSRMEFSFKTIRKTMKWATIIFIHDH